MLEGFSRAFKGLSGEFELLRVCGAFCILLFALCVPGFEIWHMAKGNAFDVVAFCAAYSASLVAVFGGVAGAVAVKDRNVATSKIIAETGAVPAKPPAGPAVPVEPQT